MTFYELEKRCKQRRLRKFLYIILGIFSAILLFIIFLFFNIKKDTKKLNNMKMNSIMNSMELTNNEVDSKKEHVFLLKENNILEKNNTKKVLNKQSVKENNIDIEKNSSIEEPLLEPIIPYVRESNKNEKNIENKYKTIKTSKNSKNSIVEVETLPSYDKCIKLAKKYLKEKKYNLALKWAKNANIQNNILPDSWMITAKALFYSGKKEKAIEILKIYLKYNNSNRVKKLLKELENEAN